MADDILFEFVLCLERLCLEFLPGIALGFGDRGCDTLSVSVYLVDRNRVIPVGRGWGTGREIDRDYRSDTEEWIEPEINKLTLYALDLAGAKACEGSLVFWASHPRRADWTLEVGNGRTGRRAALPRGIFVGHFGGQESVSEKR